jgi:hypothetical protein
MILAQIEISFGDIGSKIYGNPRKYGLVYILDTFWLKYYIWGLKNF